MGDVFSNYESVHTYKYTLGVLCAYDSEGIESRGVSVKAVNHTGHASGEVTPRPCVLSETRMC